MKSKETAEHKEQCARRSEWELKDSKYITEENYYYPPPMLSFVTQPSAFTGNPEDLCSHYKKKYSRNSPSRVVSWRSRKYRGRSPASLSPRSPASLSARSPAYKRRAIRERRASSRSSSETLNSPGWRR